MSDFPSSIVQQVGHRPWPMPSGRWIMTQSWHDLLFAHWPVDVHVLRARVPPILPIDEFDGRAWVGVIPFRMSNVAPRGVPAVPGLSAFPELNVRTYVTVGGKPGIYFFSLDTTSLLTVLGARLVFHLPYFAARMEVAPGSGRAGPVTELVRYRSRRRGGARPAAEFLARYRPSGPVQTASPGSLEYFLTERYCLYTLDRRSRVRRQEIHHPPWPLQPAEAEIVTNTMAAAAGIRLPADPPLLHFARRQDMVAWAQVTTGG